MGYRKYLGGSIFLMFSTAGFWMDCSSIRGGGASGGGFKEDTGGTPEGVKISVIRVNVWVGFGFVRV